MTFNSNNELSHKDLHQQSLKIFLTRYSMTNAGLVGSRLLVWTKIDVALG